MTAMTEPDRALLARVQDIATRAMHLAQGAEPTTADLKAPQDFVTNVDLDVDRFLEAELGALLPDCPVLSEERAATLKGPCQRYWIVDPIDGTLNMMAGLPFYAVAIALVDAEGPQLSVVAAVAQGQILSALRGQGAWLDETPLTVPADPPNMIVLSTGVMDALIDKANAPSWEALRRVGKIRNLGAQALHLCGVAQGRFAAVASIEARVWDEAAAGLILREAGGVWTSMADNHDWRFPADLMAVPQQRSIATHALVTDQVNTALEAVFSALAMPDTVPVSQKDARSVSWKDPEHDETILQAFALDVPAKRIILAPRELPGLVFAKVTFGATGQHNRFDKDEKNWPARLHFDCPDSSRFDTRLRLELGYDTGEHRFCDISLDQLPSAPRRFLGVSRLEIDLVRDHLTAGGWAWLPDDARISIFANNQHLADAKTGQRRPDVSQKNKMLPSNLGWSLTATLPPEMLADVAELHELALEWRVDSGKETVLSRAVDLGQAGSFADPAILKDRELYQAACRKAPHMPRARLEWLLASQAFHRRWSAPDGGRAWMVREVIAQEMAQRLKTGDEIAIRLRDSDLVLCQPVDDSVLARLFLFQAEDEAGFIEWIVGQVKPGNVALDIGGGYGVVARAMARRGARVLSVEADPVSASRIARMQRQFDGGGEVTVIEAAVTDKPGDVSFAGMGQSLIGSGKILTSDDPETVQSFLDEVSGLKQVPLGENQGAAGRETRQFKPSDLDVVTQKGITIDALCAEHDLRDIAIMKIDIEGGELMALRGASGLLDGQFGPPPVVAFEYSNLFPIRGGRREEILDVFFDRGWRLYHMTDGKTGGGALVEFTTHADAPGHDNVIAVPPRHMV